MYKYAFHLIKFSVLNMYKQSLSSLKKPMSYPFNKLYTSDYWTKLIKKGCHNKTWAFVWDGFFILIGLKFHVMVIIKKFILIIKSCFI